jgi:hypothetical protein
VVFMVIYMYFIFPIVTLLKEHYRVLWNFNRNWQVGSLFSRLYVVCVAHMFLEIQEHRYNFLINSKILVVLHSRE